MCRTTNYRGYERICEQPWTYSVVNDFCGSRNHFMCGHYKLFDLSPKANLLY